MATPKSQRIGIWVIAIVMLVGTIGSFAVMILASQNDGADQARLQQLNAEYQKKSEEHQKKVNAQAAVLSKKYYKTFQPYQKYPKSFDERTAKKLSTKDLKAGTGKALGKDPSFTAYYIGWMPNGTVFDSSFEGKSLKAPFSAAPGASIPGFLAGAEGMKVGGIREITMPADQAYGEQGSTDQSGKQTIPPNTPLKFIIMIIPTPKQIPAPEVPQELLEAYQSGGMQ